MASQVDPVFPKRKCGFLYGASKKSLIRRIVLGSSLYLFAMLVHYLLSTFGFHGITWNKAALKNSEGLSVAGRACDLMKLKAEGTERVEKQHLSFIFQSTKCSTLRGWKPVNNGYKLINASWTLNFISFALDSHGMKCINSTIRVDREPYFSVSRWVPIMRTWSQALLRSLPIPSSLFVQCRTGFYRRNWKCQLTLASWLVVIALSRIVDLHLKK